MDKYNPYVVIIAVIVAAVVIILVICKKKREGLSMSQFPIPTCSTCKSCSFYSCNRCGTIYQLQNKEDAVCDCGGFIVYRTKEYPSCYQSTLKSLPEKPVVLQDPSFMLPKKKEGFENEEENSGKARISKSPGCYCPSTPKLYFCRSAAGTFDGGSTWEVDVPCPVPFPPVNKYYHPVAQKQLRHVSELDVYRALEDGQLIIAAKNSNVVKYLLKKLIEQTEARGSQGYPDFYYVDGPVIVMKKVGDEYYYVIDYPIKYNPENVSNYVNKTKNWLLAKTAYQLGRNLLSLDAPFFFFSKDADAPTPTAVAAACQPEGAPQSSTDCYGGKCVQTNCIWGPQYGSGNWLTRV